MSVSKPQVDFVRKVYRNLYDRFGPQYWWPADSDFEVIVGAVLTQNTNWKNVEKAVANLKSAGVLSLEKLHEMHHDRLAEYIKPAGYFNVKAKRLKHVVAFIVERFDASLENMREEPLEVLRPQLLAVNGVGPETADSILLYALDKSVFVVDAYTRRFMIRHNWVSYEASYDDIQKIFTGALKNDVKIFNEYHALIVRLAKEHCNTVPDCVQCPLVNFDYDLLQRCGDCYRSLDKEKRLTDTRTQENTILCKICQSRKSSGKA